MEVTQSKEVRRDIPLTTKLDDVQDLIDFLTSLLKRNQYHRSDDVYVLIGKNYYSLNAAAMIDDRVIIEVKPQLVEPFDCEAE